MTDAGAVLASWRRQLAAATEQLAPLGLDGALADLRDAALARELRLVVVGRFKSGKSSVVNLLAGAPVSAVDVLPCTTHAIELPLPSLGAGVMLVDTPGSDEDADRSAIAEREIDRADAALLVLRATQPAGLHELDRVAQLARRGVAVLVVLNRVDEIDADGRGADEVLAFTRQRVAELGVAPARVLLLSALHGTGGAALREAALGLVRGEVMGLRLCALYRRVEIVTDQLASRLAAIAATGPAREQARAAGDALSALRQTLTEPVGDPRGPGFFGPSGSTGER